MKSNLTETFDALNSDLVACKRCPRLVEWRERIAGQRRAAFRDETYWAKPAPNFGDPSAYLLIIGLAPAAHGANRTGRMFTGDKSGDFLFAALHRAGIANQAESRAIGDGLELMGVMITAAVHCAPPDNKPLPSEFEACQPFLLQLLGTRYWRAILCLGGIGWIAAFDGFKRMGLASGPRPKFGHGAEATLACGTRLVGSYHPSQQNTFTGRLTPAMMDDVIKKFLDKSNLTNKPTG